MIGSTKPVLRRARPSDAPAVARLADQAYQPWISIIGVVPLPMTADYAALIGKDEVWLTGPADNLTGSLVLKLEPDHLLLWSIAVSPEAHGRGIGKALLGFTMDRAREHDLPEVRLFTNIKMQSNHDWYARNGFREIGQRIVGDKHVVIMSCPA